jgi:hypothetical protein
MAYASRLPPDRRKPKSRIYAYDTTPYGIEQQGDKWFVRQMWWAKNIAGPFDTKEQADDALVPIARAAGCYKAMREKI